MKMLVKNKTLVVVFSLFLGFLLTAADALEGLIKFSGKKDATVLLEIAVTEEEKAKGLMNRPNLADNRGMVFIFRPAKQVTFWMKDTLIPLDMIFINRGKIVKIAKNTLPNQISTVYPSEFDVTEVVEVNGGFTDRHGIKVGDSITFENIGAIDYSGKSELMIIER